MQDEKLTDDERHILEEVFTAAEARMSELDPGGTLADRQFAKVDRIRLNSGVLYAEATFTAPSEGLCSANCGAPIQAHSRVARMNDGTYRHVGCAT